MADIPELPGSYRPGDVVNGHILTERGHWVELGSERAKGLRPRFLGTQVSTIRDPDKPASELSGREREAAERAMHGSPYQPAPYQPAPQQPPAPAGHGARPAQPTGQSASPGAQQPGPQQPRAQQPGPRQPRPQQPQQPYGSPPQGQAAQHPGPAQQRPSPQHPGPQRPDAQQSSQPYGAAGRAHPGGPQQPGPQQQHNPYGPPRQSPTGHGAPAPGHAPSSANLPYGAPPPGKAPSAGAPYGAPPSQGGTGPHGQSQGQPAPAQGGNTTTKISCGGCLVALVVIIAVIVGIVVAVNVASSSLSSTPEPPAWEEGVPDDAEDWATAAKDLTELTSWETWQAKYASHYAVTIAAPGLDHPGVLVTARLEATDANGNTHELHEFATLRWGEPVQVVGYFPEPLEAEVVDMELTVESAYAPDLGEYDAWVEDFELIDSAGLRPGLRLHLEAKGDHAPGGGRVVVVVRDDAGQIVNLGSAFPDPPAPGETVEADIYLWGENPIENGTFELTVIGY